MLDGELGFPYISSSDSFKVWSSNFEVHFSNKINNNHY